MDIDYNKITNANANANVNPTANSDVLEPLNTINSVLIQSNPATSPGFAKSVSSIAPSSTSSLTDNVYLNELNKATGLTSNNGDMLNSSMSFNNMTEYQSESFFDFFKEISVMGWILIIFILIFLGFNIFKYLAIGTDEIVDIFTSVLNWFIMSINTIFGTTFDILKTSKQQIVETTKEQPKNTEENELYEVLNKQTDSNIPDFNDYQADESTSEIQTSSSMKKSGWCYIGQDRGFRTCAKVGEQDTCLSGKIFPSHDICINPSLRQ